MNKIEILNKLIELQGNQNDTVFAEQLGIHRISWNYIKNHKRPISDKFLVRVDRAFPELNIFLHKKDTNGSDTDTNASQTSKNIFSKILQLITGIWRKYGWRDLLPKR